MPEADNITLIVAEAIRRGIPFACLVPISLIHRISQKPDYSVDHFIQKEVDKSDKIVLTEPGMTWLIFGMKGVDKTKTVYTAVFDENLEEEINNYQVDMENLTKNFSENDPFPGRPAWGTREEWIDHQQDVIHAYRADQIWTAPDGLRYFKSKHDKLTVIVPLQHQRALVQWHHRNLCHMSGGKLYNYLSKRYHWHFMSTYCKKLVAQCKLCNLLKRRMNLAHKHFRAKLHTTPRTSYGADFIKVKKTVAGYSQILGIIDLATGNLVLRALKSRTGLTTARVILYDIILKKGVPLLFHSDGAKEFLHGASRMLSAMLGYRQTTTKAHNPEANGKIERVWAYVAGCLRTMTKEQYQHLHIYMDVIAHVWNTQPDSDTNITPFENEHGMRARSVADSLVDIVPQAAEGMTGDDLKVIMRSTKAFLVQLQCVKAVEKVRSALALNEKGLPRKDWKVGDKVAFFIPPADLEVQDSKKRAKHLLQYRGPATLVEKLSPNGTTWKLEHNGRFYERHCKHFEVWKANEDVHTQLVVNDFVIGTYLAYRMTNQETNYHLAKIVDITDNIATIWHMCTKGRHLRSAKWYPLYTNPNGHGVLMKRPNIINAADYKLISKMTVISLHCVTVVPKIKFRNHKILFDSIQELNNKNLQHHVYQRTWLDENLMVFDQE